MKEVWIALGLTVFAGMATGIGSVVAFAARRTNYRFLAIATGFSAGVMLYVSFVEIFLKGVDSLTESYGDYWGHWVNADTEEPRVSLKNSVAFVSDDFGLLHH